MAVIFVRYQQMPTPDGEYPRGSDRLTILRLVPDDAGESHWAMARTEFLSRGGEPLRRRWFLRHGLSPVQWSAMKERDPRVPRTLELPPPSFEERSVSDFWDPHRRVWVSIKKLLEESRAPDVR